MNIHTLPKSLCEQLTANPLIEQHLESVIWFGSIRNNQDIHKTSDYDVQTIFDTPSYELTLAINKVFKDYAEVDLSIMYLQDILDSNGNIIFHDGTKSIFFMYVLAAGEVLYGHNVYADIITQLTLEDSKPSLLVTAREYLSRLRVMAAQSDHGTAQFKKYSLKLFKDILLYKEKSQLENITTITNEFARDNIMQLHSFSKESIIALGEITRYDKFYSQAQLAALLQDFETVIKEMTHE